MEIFVLGMNHNSAPLKVRERFSLGSDQIKTFLADSFALPHVEEVVVLSTCNRVEIYGVSEVPLQAQIQLSQYLCQYHHIESELIKKHFYFFHGSEALSHGFRVGASLDSMILGESQILGQVKEAYRFALESETTGKYLNKFFHQIFNLAKKIRTDTSIAQNPVSISYVAVVLAKQIFGDLSGRKALILGAGKMSELAIKHLKESGIRDFFIANRTRERSEIICEKLGGQAIPFESFSKWLVDSDIVLTSTNAPHFLVEAKMVQEAIHQRKNKPIFFIDIAVPRDVSPEVNQIPNAYLYDLDDLQHVVEVNKKERLKEAEQAELMIEQEVGEFVKVLKAIELVPTISSLANKYDALCRIEIEKALQKLPQLDDASREVIEKMAQSIVKKVLHHPMVVLKEEASQNDSTDYTSVIRKLFRLDEAS